MANSTTHLTTISASQSQKEVTANALFDAMSPAALFARNDVTSAALTWGYYGGVLLVDGTPTAIANNTLSLSASATNYIEATRAGVVSKNTTGFSAGSIPLYTVVTSASAVSTYTDHRLNGFPVTGRVAKSVAGAVDVTLSHIEARCDILELTGALTGNINVIVPAGVKQWTVFNNTSGAFILTVKTASGTGVAIGQGKRALLYADGTNVVRATADV